ncbi:hypothetical protein GCM10009102_01790 [Sphingomonas insulae]|uniref:Uncharacterized protein n=1 Tax=Sphingomonas insulae TaxID=424800 RepID=A0ABP3SPJ9_9SPHN
MASLDIGDLVSGMERQGRTVDARKRAVDRRCATVRTPQMGVRAPISKRGVGVAAGGAPVTPG